LADSVAGAALQTVPPAPADLARALQTRYADIRDFRADFTQTVSGGVLRMVQTEQRGQVSIKKPGRMRWTYEAPHHQVMVSDGSRLYFYNASDRTGVMSPLPAGDDLSMAILFLTGRGNLERDFTATMPATHPPGEWHLALTPKVQQDEFATLTLAIDRAALTYRGFSWTDHQGGANTIRFANLRENVGLSDKEFLFAFPRGTHITRSGGGF
jgi:outer membrane lipoprotein carrier protein